LRRIFAIMVNSFFASGLLYLLGVAIGVALRG
jgi:hypothetical protein